MLSYWRRHRCAVGRLACVSLLVALRLMASNILLQDPGFTLLHYVAMLGHITLAEALETATPEAMHRFANLAR